MEEIILDDLNKNQEMIWLEDPTKYEYVRKSEFICCARNYKPINKAEEKKYKWKLIGYQKPEKIEVCSDGIVLYRGIYFWLKSYDRGMPDEKLVYGDTDAPEWYRPTEAVKILGEVDLQPSSPHDPPDIPRPWPDDPEED